MRERNVKTSMTRHPSVSGEWPGKRKLVVTPTEEESESNPHAKRQRRYFNMASELVQIFSCYVQAQGLLQWKSLVNLKR